MWFVIIWSVGCFTASVLMNKHKFYFVVFVSRLRVFVAAAESGERHSDTAIHPGRNNGLF